MGSEAGAAKIAGCACHGQFRFGFHTLNIHQAVDVFKEKMR
jgi:hypothetical protein